jgi:hypothetical protein
MDHPDDIPHASVPADIGTPDRIAFGLTFRQLAIVGIAALGGWLIHRLAGPLLPPSVWLIAALPVAALTGTVALGRRDGRPLDVWLRHAVTLTGTPRLYAPGRPGPTASMKGRPPVPAPLRPLVDAISPTGRITTRGTEGMLIACGTTNVHLRTGDEQAALVDAYGRFLNALTGPAQVVVSAQRHDLTPYARAVADAALRLPDPALRAAAAGHAAFLQDLDSTWEPLRRQVLAVVPAGHAEAAARALAGLGISTAVLNGQAVTAALAAAVDPYASPPPGPRAVPGTPITLRSPT